MAHRAALTVWLSGVIAATVWTVGVTNARREKPPQDTSRPRANKASNGDISSSVVDQQRAVAAATDNRIVHSRFYAVSCRDQPYWLPN
jgi:hypothetical protein